MNRNSSIGREQSECGDLSRLIIIINNISSYFLVRSETKTTAAGSSVVCVSRRVRVEAQQTQTNDQIDQKCSALSVLLLKLK